MWYVHAVLRRPRERLLYCVGAVLAGALLLLLAPTTVAADPASGLRAKGKELASRERAALIELYSLDSRLEAVRAELAGLRAQETALGRELNGARRDLRVARRTLTVAQRRLAEEVRLLYEQDRLDVLAVVFGASSLEELVSGLDSLSRAASATSAVVDQAHAARRHMLRLARSLSQRRAALSRLRTAVAAKEAGLAEARAERAATIARLQFEQRLTAQQITTLDAKARAAEAKAKAETIEAQAAGSVASFGAAPPALDPPAQTSAPAALVRQAAPPAAGRTLTVLSTGYSLPGTTATGLPVAAGIVAVDPTVIPLGTRMTIPGYGEGVAADTGSAIRGLRIDLWFPTEKQALAWGWQTITITLD